MTTVRPARVCAAIVLRVEEQVCDVRSEGVTRTVPFAPQFPTPRVERVWPGHLAAVATSPDGVEVVVWRWFDAVVIGEGADGTVTLWEPAHGAVDAQRRRDDARYEPGSRAYLSAGLPGAEWWVAGPVLVRAGDADVELDEVEQLYTSAGLWDAAFAG